MPRIYSLNIELISIALSVYPSLLRDGVMRNLEILFRESPCPTPLVINTWADVLHVQREDVKTWVKLEREKLEQVHPYLCHPSTKAHGLT